MLHELHHRWFQFWEVFWDFGHMTTEIMVDLLTGAVAYLFIKPWIRKHDAKHHHHIDHGEDA